MGLSLKQLESVIHFAKAAVLSERKYGVPAELPLAQAIIESGWGKHCPCYNPLGIKQAMRHKEGQSFTTGEVTPDGKPVVIKAKFAVFDSIEEAFLDHGWLITNAKVYRPAWDKYLVSENLEGLIHGIAKVYASDPTYAGKILKVLAIKEVQDALVAARADSTRSV